MLNLDERKTIGCTSTMYLYASSTKQDIMPLSLTHKVNQGVHVEGRGHSLDLIVRDV